MNEGEAPRIKDFAPVFLMMVLFLLIYFLSLSLVHPFQDAGMKAFEDPDDPFNILIILMVLLVTTLIILIIAKYWRRWLIKAIILFAVGYTSFYILLPILGVILSGYVIVFLSLLIAFTITYVLWRYPEWYIIDLCGVIISTGSIVIFGISLGVLPVIILLLCLSVYDAVSVYKTKHMITLADTVMDLKLPVLFVIPKKKGYSLLAERKGLKEQLDKGEERDAFFMGVGDVVIPGVLVVSSYINLHDGLYIASGVIIGVIIGFLLLMMYVTRGKPQAGLPYLCGGGIAGYIVSNILLYGTINGLTWLL